MTRMSVLLTTFKIEIKIINDFIQASEDKNTFVHVLSVIKTFPL